MIFYLCPHCSRPAFYLTRRLRPYDRLCYQDIETNGNWVPKRGGNVYCQMCMKRIMELRVDNIMDNLEYLEWKLNGR